MVAKTYVFRPFLRIFGSYTTGYFCNILKGKYERSR